MASILDQDGARLPNSRRMANKARLAKEGLFIEDDLLTTLKALA